MIFEVKKVILFIRQKGHHKALPPEAAQGAEHGQVGDSDKPLPGLPRRHSQGPHHPVLGRQEKPFDGLERYVHGQPSHRGPEQRGPAAGVAPSNRMASQGVWPGQNISPGRRFCGHLGRRHPGDLSSC